MDLVSKTLLVTLHTMQMVLNSCFSAAVQCWTTTGYPRTKIFLLLLLDLKKKKGTAFLILIWLMCHIYQFLLVLFDEIMK